jgi:hypothetical protein
MIKIVITSPEVINRKGVGKASGKPYDFNIQTAHAFTVSDSGVIVEFPDKFEIMLDSGQAPYARGSYNLSPSALYVSRDGRLECRPRLVPVPASSKA